MRFCLFDLPQQPFGFFLLPEGIHGRLRAAYDTAVRARSGPEKRAVEVLSGPTAPGFATRRTVGADEEIAAVALPGCRMPLRELFAEARKAASDGV